MVCRSGPSLLNAAPQKSQPSLSGLSLPDAQPRRSDMRPDAASLDATAQAGHSTGQSQMNSRAQQPLVRSYADLLKEVAALGGGGGSNSHGGGVGSDNLSTTGIRESGLDEVAMGTGGSNPLFPMDAAVR